MKVKLIVGLGNIGKEYEGTRHNIGFMILEHVAEEFGASWKARKKFKATVAELGLGNQKIILAKPATYYNLSGEAVGLLADFYTIAPADILIIHDELALSFGTLRARISGNDAGNNGIKNITAHLGQHYARLKIGIANQHLSATKTEHFVLEKFTKEEAAQLPSIAEKSVHFAEDFIHDDREFAHRSVSI